jgi:glutamate synthase (NADPH/NADH) small chain
VGACVLPGVRGQAPIAIHRLQRFVAHWARERRVEVFERGWPTGHRIALVGAGPASLACAYELARLGHQPTVFESRSRVGGLSAGAIAPHKLDPALPVAEAEWLARVGIEIRPSVTIGREISFAALEREYDAVFLGVGLGADAPLGIPGEDRAAPVLGAVQLLREVNAGRLRPPVPWRRVLCVGGGNAAIDAARTLKDLGAPEVLLIRRRGEDEISGYAPEWAAARVAGVQARFRTQALEVLSREGRVTGLRCIRTVAGPPDEGGRARVVPLPGSEHEIAGDAIVRAVGRVGPKAALAGLPEDIAFDGARIAVQPDTGVTARAGWFAGGDCSNGGANVVNAAADGRRVARAIDAYLARRGKGA